MPIHVLIAGGGVGGLALAQALRRAGVAVDVFERDASASFRGQGYRIHIDDNGGAALGRCLPAGLFRAYLATSNRAPAPRISGVDHQLNELFSRDAAGPQHDPETAHSAVNRLTLREILLSGLDGVVHYGAEVTGAEADGEEALLRFADGSSVRGDVVVGADGVGSSVRRELLPGHGPQDTGLRIVYGRTLLTAERREWLPDRFFEGFTAVAGPEGSMLAVGAMRPRRPPEEAAALSPGVRLSPFAPYVMWALVAPQAQWPVPGAELPGGSPSGAHRHALSLLSGWHPVLRRLVAEAEVPDCFPLAVQTVREVPRLPDARITLLGDAVHAMPPAGGAGANTALRDAAVLADHLVAADAGATEVRGALAGYAREMRRYAAEAVQQSLHNAGLEALPT